MAATAQDAVSAWGPLSQPITTEVGSGDPPWRDNAYMAFWTSDLSTFGCYHVSTSPNSAGRRARFSLASAGTSVEIVEDIEPGSFDSPSVRFDLGDRVEISSARLTGVLECRPLFGVADYSNDAIPSLPGGTPLTHFQQAGRFVGHFVLDGREVEFGGVGIRDRTWGSRDESVSIAEYIGIMAVLGDCAITAIRMRGPGGVDHSEGFVLTESGNQAIVRVDEITRDESGLFADCELGLADGQTITLANTGRLGGFWVPMGWPRKGPVMSAYDEYDHLTADGGSLSCGTGAGMIEQGMLRTL